MNPVGHLQVGEPVGGQVLLDDEQDRILRSHVLNSYITCDIRGRACASVPAVVLALINFASIASVVGLAATLWLLVGVQDAAPAVHALDVAGTAGGSCRRQKLKVMRKHAQRLLLMFLSPPNVQRGDSVGVGSSTQVPLSKVRPLGHVQTGPLGLSRQSHSHFFLSQGLFTGRKRSGEGVLKRYGQRLQIL